MRFVPWVAATVVASAALAQTSPPANKPVDQLIPWLLDEDQQLRGVAFSEVIFDTTGKKVIPFQCEQRRRSARRESDQRCVR